MEAQLQKEVKYSIIELEESFIALRVNKNALYVYLMAFTCFMIFFKPELMEKLFT